jgi:putative transposase
MTARKPSRGMSHLGRLERIWLHSPVYFVTVCTFRRRKLLVRDEVFALLISELETSALKYGWSIGRYVVMPDHVHLFCAAVSEEVSKPLETFVGKFKEWSAKRLHHDFGISVPIWQAEFFDHVLRSEESHAEKWLYVRDNPVRAGFVTHAEDWRYAGEIAEL